MRSRFAFAILAMTISQFSWADSPKETVDQKLLGKWRLSEIRCESGEFSDLGRAGARQLEAGTVDAHYHVQKDGVQYIQRYPFNKQYPGESHCQVVSTEKWITGKSGQLEIRDTTTVTKFVNDVARMGNPKCPQGTVRNPAVRKKTYRIEGEKFTMISPDEWIVKEGKAKKGSTCASGSAVKVFVRIKDDEYPKIQN